jgi:hypothetical protein
MHGGLWVAFLSRIRGGALDVSDGISHCSGQLCALACGEWICCIDSVLPHSHRLHRSSLIATYPASCELLGSHPIAA